MVKDRKSKGRSGIGSGADGLLQKPRSLKDADLQADNNNIPEAEGSALTLSRKEAEVLQLLLRGASPARIAQRLSANESELKEHIKNILRKAKGWQALGH